MPRTPPRRCATGREVGINIAGHDHTLGPDDVQLVMAPLEGYQLEREGSHAVALELALDDGLRREGLAREVVHAVQSARRDAGLEISDRIVLTLGGDEELLAAARAHERYLAGEVLAVGVHFDANGSRRAREHRGSRAADLRRARLTLRLLRAPAGYSWPSRQEPSTARGIA